MKVGIVLGRFSPIHQGHVYMIEESAKKVDKLYVAVCFTNGETIPATIRLQWVNATLGHIKNIESIIIYEQIGSSYDGKISDYEVSFKWAKYLKAKYPDITHICGAANYVKMMADVIGAGYVTIDITHRKYQISSNNIRNHLELLDKYCIPLIKNEYLPKIAVIGIESVGKSTISKRLSELLNGELIDEYGRIYCEIHAPLEEGKDYFLTKKDFYNIAFGHNRLMLRAYERALKRGRKCVIADTEHIITQGYYKRYFGGYDSKIQEMCNFQTYDLYFYLEPLDFEDDNTRRVFSSEMREEQNKELIQMFNDFTDVKEHFYVIANMPLNDRIDSIVNIIRRELTDFL